MVQLHLKCDSHFPYKLLAQSPKMSLTTQVLQP
jgi:hypothetical protein